MVTITDAQHYLLYFLICYLSTLLLRSLFNKYSTKPTPQLHPPPSPPALPVIGHLHHLIAAHQAISFQNLSTKYGPLLNLRLGASRMLLVSSASMATEIFKTQDLAFADRPAFAFADELPYGNSGFFGAEDGDYWKFMKKICMTELFAPRQLERSRNTRHVEIGNSCKKLIESAENKEVVDLGGELVKLTNNSTCKMVMSTSRSENGDEAARIREMMMRTLGLATKVSYGDVLGPLKRLGFWLYGKQLAQVSLEFDELLEEMLKEHEKKGECLDVVSKSKLNQVASKSLLQKNEGRGHYNGWMIFNFGYVIANTTSSKFREAITTIRESHIKIKCRNRVCRNPPAMAEHKRCKPVLRHQENSEKSTNFTYFSSQVDEQLS